MSLPNDMVALEARVRALAGERLRQEPVSALARFTDPRTFHTIRGLASNVDRPIEHLFELPWLQGYQDRVSARVWRSFAQALLEWAGETEADGGLPLAIDSLDALPPLAWRGVIDWANAHGVAERLADPARNVLPLCIDAFSRYGTASLGAFPTVQSLLDGRSVRPHPAVRDAARSYLAYCAGRVAALERRRSRWSMEGAAPAVAGSIARLGALVEVLTDREPPPPIVARGTELELDEDELRVHFTYPDWLSGVHRSVWVSLTEDRSGRALASMDPDAVHATTAAGVRVAAELALDALTDEADPLHEALVAALSRPRWTRLLEGLSRAITAHGAAHAPEVEERVAWRIDEAASQVTVTPVVQRKNKRGWTKGRSLDHRALRERRDLDARDRRAVDAWSSNASYWNPDTGSLLQSLVGHPRVFHASDAKRALRVRRASLEVDLRDEGGESWLGFMVGDLELTPGDVVRGLVKSNTFARIDLPRWELVVASVPPMLANIAALAARFATPLPRKADEALIALLARLPSDVGLRVPPRLRGDHATADATPRAQLEPLPGGGLRVELRVRPLEGAPAQLPGEGPRHLFVSDPSSRRHADRDLELERRRADEAIAALHLDRAEPDGRWAWLVDAPEDALELLVAARELADRVKVEWPDGVRPWEVVGRAGFGDLKVRTKGMKHWLALRGEIAVDQETISLAAVMRALREGRRFVELAPGRFARLEDDLRARLGAVADVVFEEDSDLVLAPEASGRLRQLLPDEVLAPDPDFGAMCERLAAAGASSPDVPALTAELRPYQEEGARWLLRTASWSRGACLADDMGLGKTLQALALLMARAQLGPALVVCPTSVADNWRAEAARFAPGLSVKVYRGGERKQMAAELAAGDVLVTSYDILVRDIDELSACELATIVFDEAQALKNPETRRHDAASRLSAGFRLALTGTPLENHLGELWSIVDVLVPGLLGPPKHFKARFALPIERDGDKERLASLRALLSPFLLRRTKEQVAPDLPDRTEVVRVVELSKDEQALYEVERRRALEALGRPSKDPRQRFAILAALMKLRRLACHPALVDATSPVRSSKLDELLSLADDLVREGHRALVFSQFTSHLAIVRSALDDAGYETLYLDGATPAGERAKLVRRYQEGSAPFFLISLKAGGTGLNLTAADTVIHLDPWWNPAVEDQASDRSHRIGQTKPVTVIRLVAQGTIEESVLELHGEKRELARGLLEGAEHNARLDAGELLALLGA